MKIALFEDFFHPSAGYNINVLSKYLSKDGHEIVIFTSEINKSPKKLLDFFDANNIEEMDLEFSRKYRVEIIRLKTLFFFSGRAIIRLKHLNLIRKHSPDIIFVSGNDTFVGILFTLLYFTLGIPLLFNSSMVEMASENRFSKLFRLFYKKFITPIIVKNRIITIRSQDDPYVNEFLGIPFELAPFISFGVDLELFKPIKNKAIIRENLGVPKDAFVFIYAGKLNESKGFSLLVEALMIPFNSNRKACFLIVGDTDKSNVGILHELIHTSPNTVIHFPTQQYERLSDFYAMSDVALFPRQISLSFYNAQGCGLPVIAEENNVNKDRLSHGNGFTFEYGNSHDMFQKMIYLLNMENIDYSKMSKNAYNYAVKNFDYRKLIGQYERIFDSVIDKCTNR
jgi:glycosyltransferase involved in cell wall biosynthesis